MKTYKLTPLEQLRLEKKRVREERTVAEQRLVYQLQYINDNWGSLITRGMASSIKNKFFEKVGGGLSVFDTSSVSLIPKSRNLWLNLALSNLPMLRSVAWGLIKPALLAYATKKATSLIFGKKKK
ncbi:MAG: hypothetical protein LBR13_01370 [Dysgonamonadaceae bacterium]|jgi:hypothetical protein|nr:hypothetical protein [Dysgonamonadaceae bacterium]